MSVTKSLKCEAIGGGSVRLMTLSDIELVLSWRNHPDIRKWMRSKHVISRSEHVNWFNRLLENPLKSAYVYEEHGIPVAFAQTSDLGEDKLEWGFYCSPESERGVGTRFGRCFVDFIFSYHKCQTLIGQVAVNNVRSCRFHARLGFKGDVEVQDGYLCYKLSAQNWFSQREEIST